jgi:hypothetical protein
MLATNYYYLFYWCLSFKLPWDRISVSFWFVSFMAKDADISSCTY